VLISDHSNHRVLLAEFESRLSACRAGAVVIEILKQILISNRNMKRAEIECWLT